MKPWSINKVLIFHEMHITSNKSISFSLRSMNTNIATSNLLLFESWPMTACKYRSTSSHSEELVYCWIYLLHRLEHRFFTATATTILQWFHNSFKTRNPKTKQEKKRKKQRFWRLVCGWRGYRSCIEVQTGEEVRRWIKKVKSTVVPVNNTKRLKRSARDHARWVVRLAILKDLSEKKKWEAILAK